MKIAVPVVTLINPAFGYILLVLMLLVFLVLVVLALTNPLWRRDK